MPLQTEWIRIGTSGPTADGRNIEAAWIDDMAETYDPQEYQALIWPDHERYFGNFGKVAALRADNDDKGRRVLFAKLEPKPMLITLNRNGSYLFASMEISPKNFGGSSKRYLVGLGVTDEPAALGMAELKLSKKHGDVEQFAGCERFSLPDLPDEQAPGWFTRFIEKFGGAKPPLTQEEDTMTKEDLERVTGAIADGFSQLESAISEKFAAMSQAQAERFAAEDAGEAEADESEANALIELRQQVADLAAKFDALEKTPVAGTHVPEHLGQPMEHYS